MRNLIKSRQKGKPHNRFIRGKVLNLKMGGRSIQLFRWYVTLLYLVDLTKGQINYENCLAVQYIALPSTVPGQFILKKFILGQFILGQFVLRQFILKDSLSSGTVYPETVCPETVYPQGQFILRDSLSSNSLSSESLSLG